jgi:hypothetical protein
MEIYQEEFQQTKEKNINSNQIKYDKEKIKESKNKNNKYKEKINDNDQKNSKRINNESNTNLDENGNKKSYYYFNYDNNLNIRNYYPKKSGKTEYSTEQNTIINNYKESSKNGEKINKEMKNSAFDLIMKINEKEIKGSTISKKEENIYYNNYIKFNGNMEGEINNIYDKRIEDDNKIIDKSNNQNIKKLKYINDINNVIIFDSYKKI